MPKIIDHKKYKEELLLKCFDIFTRKGFDRITLREISSELEISPGSLYYYFPAKSNILEEMFDFYTKRDVEAMLLMFNDSDTYSDKLVKIFEYVASNESYFQKILLLTIDYFRFDMSNSNHNRLNKYAVNYMEGIGTALGFPDELSSMLMLFLNGLIYHRMIFQDMASFEKQTGNFIQMIKLLVEDKQIDVK